MDSFQFIKNLTKELQEYTKKASEKKTFATHWLPGGMFILLTFLTILLLYHPNKSLFDFILTIFLISVFSTLTCLWVSLLRKHQIESQKENEAWQNKLIDAYGKLLEAQVKSEMEGKPDELKKKEEERKEILDKKKHDLEIAKLDYEIARFQYRKDHVSEE